LLLGVRLLSQKLRFVSEVHGFREELVCS
jgi:hypothetical protein